MWSCLDGAGMGSMMIGMGLFWLLAIVGLVLGIAALVKYLTGRPDRRGTGEGP